MILLLEFKQTKHSLESEQGTKKGYRRRRQIRKMETNEEDNGEIQQSRHRRKIME